MRVQCDDVFGVETVHSSRCARFNGCVTLSRGQKDKEVMGGVREVV